MPCRSFIWLWVRHAPCHKPLASLSALLLATLLCLPSSGAQKKEKKEKEEDPLAPAGLALLQEKLKSYPAFDEEKVKADAEAKFKLAKVGDEITVKHRKGQISGVLRSIDKKSVQIGDKSVFFIDMDAKEIARFFEDKTKDLRTDYVKPQQELYESDLKAFAEKTRKEFLEKYPALGKKKLADLFSRLKDRSQAESLTAEFAEAYDKSLPLSGTKTEHIAKVAQGLVALKKGLLFDGKNFRTIAEVEEEKQQLEAETQRLEELKTIAEQRSKERLLLPKTASPVFKPDGGLYTPSQKIELTCPTAEATIKYTTDGKEPTEDSATYSEPITADTPKIIIKAKAFHPLFNDSETSVSAPFLEQGAGLYASYFSKINGTGRTVNRIDKKIDFTWKTKESPEPTMPAEFFSIIWTGRVATKFSETYKFTVTIDDGVRLWIDDNLVIDQWNDPQVTSFTAEVKAAAGARYDIKLAMCNGGGPGKVVLEWSSPSTPKEVIPSANLYPDGKYTSQLQKWNQASKEGGGYVNRQSMANPLGNGKTIVPKTTRQDPLKYYKLE